MMHFQSIALAVTGSIIMHQVGASLILDMVVNQKDISRERVIETGGDAAMADCCFADPSGMCPDGTIGTPYCAYGGVHPLFC